METDGASTPSRSQPPSYDGVPPRAGAGQGTGGHSGYGRLFVGIGQTASCGGLGVVTGLSKRAPPWPPVEGTHMVSAAFDAARLYPECMANPLRSAEGLCLLLATPRPWRRETYRGIQTLLSGVLGTTKAEAIPMGYAWASRVTPLLLPYASGANAETLRLLPQAAVESLAVERTQLRIVADG